MTLLKVLLASLVLVGIVNCHPTYRSLIPNGLFVPDPCNTAVIWNGVGHMNHSGGGDRNPFGLAFAANNHTWTTALCQMDSDQDGETNGQELGDPTCVWTPGTNTTNPVRSHPGVCNPVTSENCIRLQPWLYCNSASVNLPSIIGSLLLLLTIYSITTFY